MEDLISKLVKLPMATKLVAVLVIAVAVTAGNYFLWPGVSELYDKIGRAESKRASLRDTLIEKQAIANNLNQFRRELEIVEQRLKEALTEMPEEVRIDDLLTQLAELAKKAGLKLEIIAPQKESREGGFYYKIPIKMDVTGGYHEIAVFLDSVSKLKRIINVNNIDLGSPKSEADKIVLKANYLATTFRFAGEEAAPKKKAKGAK